ncbi:MAG: hypothetical protein PGN24_01265 [Microbacterium arborescens]
MRAHNLGLLLTTPVVAATLLGIFANNYASIFVFAAIMVLLSSVLVFPIRSVR